MIRAFSSHRLVRPLTAALLVFCAVSASAPAALADTPPPVPGGKIGTLILGRYACELPGDAGGLIGRRMPEYDFTIVNASSYVADGVRGSYLLTGTQVVMTSGKLRNMRFERVSAGFLRQAGDTPWESTIRCIRASRR